MSSWQIMHKKRAEQARSVFGSGAEAWERRTLALLVSAFVEDGLVCEINFFFPIFFLIF